MASYSLTIDFKEFAQVLINASPKLKQRIDYAINKQAVSAVDSTVRGRKQSLFRTPQDTGKLKRSHQKFRVSFKEAILYPTVDYALYQHEGFRHYGSGRFVRPRPYLANALKDNEEKIINYLSLAMDGVFK